jgi:putative inorganic carbon (HCO3(-)) transporter
MLSFRLFLMASFVLLGRPQDLLPFLDPLRPALVLTALSLGSLMLSDARKEVTAALATPESKRFIALFIIMVLGVPFAYHKGLAFQGAIVTYVINVLFFVLLVSSVTTFERLESFVWVACLAALTYGFFGGFLMGGLGPDGRFRIRGSAFDPNDIAFVLLGLLPLCLYFVLFNAGILKRLLAVVAMSSASLVILQTGSRGGLIALGTVLLLMLTKKLANVKKWHKMLFVVILASIAFVMRDKIDVDRYMTLTDISDDYNMTADGGRIELWGSAIDLALSNPLTGVGVECFPFAHLQVRQAEGESFLRWQYTHNSYLQVASELGLIGFALYMFMLARSFLTFLRLGREDSPPDSSQGHKLSAISGFMLLGCTGLVIAGIFLSQAYSIFYTLYFALPAVMNRVRAGLSSAAAVSAPVEDAERPPIWTSFGRH